MKKKILFLSMGLCILMLAGGCAKKDLAENVNSATGTSATIAPTGTSTGAVSGAATDTTDTTTLPKVEDYVVGDYVTLGDYKGVAVTVTQLTVTDEDVNAAIQEDLTENATQEDVTDRAVQDGDTVNIDFEGLVDGVAFDGGTATGYDLVIGSGSFIDGFESGIIGAKIGDKLSLPLTFPADYSEDLAGKDVVFNVTVNSISKTIVPELTEEYVTTNTDYKTIDEYKEGIRTELEATNTDTMDNEKANNVVQAVIDNATIKSIPETLTNYYTAQMNYQFEQEAAAYGMELADYIAQYGMSQDDYDSYVASLVQSYATRDLIINAVATAEKMESTDDEYKEAITNYMSYYSVSTEAALLEQVTEDEIKDSVVMKKAYNFIVDNAVVTMATPTATPTTAPTK